MISPLDRNAAFYVAGHTGMAGSALWSLLQEEGFTNLIGRTSKSLDLTDRDLVFDFFQSERPQYVVLAAAKVGGIQANNLDPVGFLTKNLRIQSNVMDASLEFGVKRFVFLGSSCIYPKSAPQPLKEEYLLTGPLEPTNEAYAIAKIAGITQVQSVRKQYGFNWMSVMPTNLYGPGDNYREGESHVLAALVRRFVEAQKSGAEHVTNWGTGSPKREFLHSGDLARGIFHVMEKMDTSTPVNIGSGEEFSIRDLSDLIQKEVGFSGQVFWDSSMPDGVQRKLLDRTVMAGSGWTPVYKLREELSKIIRELLTNSSPWS